MGQETIEFLLVFMLGLALVATLAASIIGEITAARAKVDSLRATRLAGALTCALEAAFMGGGDVVYPTGAGPRHWRIENGVLHASYEGRVVEIRGVFNEDQSEPV